jgi:hypothetical protein
MTVALLLAARLRTNVSAAIMPAFLFLDDPPLAPMDAMRTNASMVQAVAELGYAPLTASPRPQALGRMSPVDWHERVR